MLGLLGGFAAASAAAPSWTFTSPLFPEPHPATVRVIPYGEEGRVVPWEDFVRHFADTTLGMVVVPEEPPFTPVCNATFLCGRDEGYGIFVSSINCDNSSAWVQYRWGTTAAGAPGASILEATDHGVSELVTCAGFFGPTHDWEVELSVWPVITGMVPRLDAGLDGCFATVWTLHPDGYCPKSFTGPDTFGAIRARGLGVLVTFEMGDHAMDYFLGRGAGLSYRPMP